MFSVLVICKLYVNMYTALRRIQVSPLLFLPVSCSSCFQGYLGSYYLTTWPGYCRVPSQSIFPPSPSYQRLSLTSPFQEGYLRKVEYRGGRQNGAMPMRSMAKVANEGGEEDGGLCQGNYPSRSGPRMGSLQLSRGPQTPGIP